MDELQQRIVEIALQIPGYLGYEAKERRRDVDKSTRLQLAAKYDAEHTHLSRIARNAPMTSSVPLENLDQKLQRLIARFQTAPRGYAGWFDAAQIVEDDLDALTQFDAALASGVPQLKSTIDAIASTLKSKQGIDDAMNSCAELLDTLNERYDQREQLLATGKKPTLDIFANAASPLDALAAKKQPSADVAALIVLKLNDAVSYAETDFIVSGKITYNAGADKFWAFLLKDNGKELWLHIGPGDSAAAYDEIKLRAESPLPDSVEYNATSFAKDVSGTANVTVEGAGGTRRGSVEYARYIANEAQVWVEDFGRDARAMLGKPVDVNAIKVYRR